MTPKTTIRTVKELSPEMLERVKQGDIFVVKNFAPNLPKQYAQVISKKTNKHIAAKDLSRLHSILTYEEIRKLRTAMKNAYDETLFIQDTFNQHFSNIGVAEKYLIESTIHFRIQPPSKSIPKTAPITERTPPPIHQDSWYDLPFDSLNFWIALVPVKDNGVMFFPEHFGTNVPFVFDEELNTEKPAPGTALGKKFEPLLQPGDCVVFAGRHLHGTVKNTSNTTRISTDYRILAHEHIAPCSTLHDYHYVHLNKRHAKHRTHMQVLTSTKLLREGRLRAAWSASPFHIRTIKTKISNLNLRSRLKK
jgi:hypothetical protein